MAICKIGGRLVIRFVFTFVRGKVKFVREKSGKCQGISRNPVCGNHVLEINFENFRSIHVILYGSYSYESVSEIKDFSGRHFRCRSCMMP